MEVLHPRCAGLDVHKDTVVAAVRCASPPVHHEVQSFATTTRGLLGLADWLSSQGCTHVAMEATGVYWKPLWHVLEERFALVLANAQHVRNVPGRKTDVGDAAWIADLLAHGLIRSSFVPPAPIQELRDLTRTRKQLVREISQHSLRIQKVLEDANLKLGSVLSDVLGQSGRAMLKAIIAGEDDPVRLAELAQGTARRKTAVLIEALRGRVTTHHRAMLQLHLGVVDALESALDEVDRNVGKALEPIRDLTRLLTTMPGVGDLVAQVIVAEIGIDMSRFPSSAHLVSWAEWLGSSRGLTVMSRSRVPTGNVDSAGERAGAMVANRAATNDSPTHRVPPSASAYRVSTAGPFGPCSASSTRRRTWGTLMGYRPLGPNDPSPLDSLAPTGTAVCAESQPIELWPQRSSRRAASLSRPPPQRH